MSGDINSSESFLKLFCDDVVWDASRFNVVLNMTASECQVMVKRTTWQLRENFPKFVEAFKQLPDLHQSLAASSVNNTVSESNLAQGEILDAAGEKVVRLNKRRADGSVNAETKEAVSAMHMLNKVQQHHMEILLLTEKFKACQKTDSASKVGLFADEIKSIHGLLDVNLDKSMRKLDRIDFLVNGLSVAELNESLLSASQGNSEPALMTLDKASCVIETFRATNRAITGELRQRVNNITDECCPIGRIFPRAA